MDLNNLRKNLLVTSVLMLVLSLASCSSDDTSGSENTPTAVEPATGQLVDAPVEGVSYKTETQSGVTNSEGKFQYLPDETVVFSIGDITFPAVKPDPSKEGLITPLELAGTQDLDNKVVQNIIRLLQTLDSNANPDDGITIRPNLITTASLNFNAEPAAFESEVKSAINVTLISYEDALAHFEAELERINYYGDNPGGEPTSGENGDDPTTPVQGGVVESTSGDVHIQMEISQIDGGMFRLDVNAVDTPLVYGVDVHVEFDPNVLTVVDQNETKDGAQPLAGDFFGDRFIYLFDGVYEGNIVKYTISMLNPAVDISNTGTLMSVFFTPEADADTTIKLLKTDFGDSEGGKYVATPVDMDIAVTEAGSVTVQ
ncbi:MAG: cohesin domain-containing protein [Pseudomonadota bacterium]